MKALTKDQAEDLASSMLLIAGYLGVETNPNRQETSQRLSRAALRAFAVLADRDCGNPYHDRKCAGNLPPKGDGDECIPPVPAEPRS